MKMCSVEQNLDQAKKKCGI